jgi:hypothetical protein
MLVATHNPCADHGASTVNFRDKSSHHVYVVPAAEAAAMRAAAKRGDMICNKLDAKHNYQRFVTNTRHSDIRASISASHDVKAANALAEEMTAAYAGEDFKAPIPNAELVDELCTFLGKEYTEQFNRDRNAHWVNPADRPHSLPRVKFDDDGITRDAVTRENFEHAVEPWKYALGELMTHVPRERGERIADYRDRLCLSSGDPWRLRMTNMAICVSHIQRIEKGEADARANAVAQRKREEEQHQERRRQEREQDERHASPDPKEIKRLRAIVDEASEAYRLLALHDKAQAATLSLYDIYEKECNACMRLGKPVPDISKYGLAPVVHVERGTPLNGEWRGRDTTGSKLSRG